MKSKVASAWKSINSKIHPPLPLPARDVQQLLSLLNTSFKQQLGRQHLAASSSNEDNANRHLQSILTNPLFDVKPRTSDIATSKSQRLGQSPGQIPNHMTLAMDVFRQRVSRGTADLKVAKHCLSIQHRACKTPSATTPREAMQSSGTASIVLQWLWSSGLEETGIFLNDLKFVKLLVPFLVADGQHSRISHWLQRCPSQGGRPFSSLNQWDKLRIPNVLFWRLILEEVRTGDGLESAINLFHRTVADLLSCGHADKLIGHYAHRAAWFLTKNILRIPRSTEPQPPIFDALSETIRKLKSDDLLNANCSVFIQKTPDPQPALKWFQNLSDSSTGIKYSSQRPEIIFLGLKTAELFLQNGGQAEALWMMNFLQTNFEPELGLPLLQDMKNHSYEPKERLRQQEKSLRLLDTLTVQ